MKVKLKGIVEEDFVNYKKPSLFVAFPTCNFKCGDCCQNKALAAVPDIEIGISELVERYMNNPITTAVVLGGLEPFDSWDDLFAFIMNLRYYTPDDIVIYSGYTEEELANKIEQLKGYENIIIKFGRFIPQQKKHFDKTLGIELASSN